MTTQKIPIGDGLLGRAIDVRGQPLDDRGALQNVHLVDAVLGPPAVVNAPVLWDTGIKVIDLYAPLALGSTIVFQAAPGVGMAVTRDELIYRLADQHGGCAVFALLGAERNTLREKLAQIRETGVEQHTTLVAGSGSAAPDEQRQVCRTALVIAEAFVAQGRDVLLVVDDSLLIPETMELLTEYARTVRRGSLTILFCFWQHDNLDMELNPSVRPFVDTADTRLVFRRELARQAIWPAIDPLASSSRFLHLEYVAAEQLRVAEAARTLLSGTAQSEPEQSRAHKLRLFQAQPFFVAEPFTAHPSTYVPRAESVRTFDAILTGAYDTVAPEALQFTGRAR